MDCNIPPTQCVIALKQTSVSDAVRDGIEGSVAISQSTILIKKFDVVPGTRVLQELLDEGAVEIEVKSTIRRQLSGSAKIEVDYTIVIPASVKNIDSLASDLIAKMTSGSDASKGFQVLLAQSINAALVSQGLDSSLFSVSGVAVKGEPKVKLEKTYNSRRGITDAPPPSGAFGRGVGMITAIGMVLYSLVFMM